MVETQEHVLNNAIKKNINAKFYKCLLKSHQNLWHWIFSTVTLFLHHAIEVICLCERSINLPTTTTNII